MSQNLNMGSVTAVTLLKLCIRIGMILFLRKWILSLSDFWRHSLTNTTTFLSEMKLVLFIYGLYTFKRLKKNRSMLYHYITSIRVDNVDTFILFQSAFVKCFEFITNFLLY